MGRREPDPGQAARLFGLIGDTAEGSRLPSIFNHALRLSGLSDSYTPLRVSANEDLADTLDALRSMGYVGLDLEEPLEKASLELIDRPSPHVQVLGTANMLQLSERGIAGHNTLVTSVVAALEALAGCTLEGKRVVIYGAGAVGRAVALGVLEAGASAVTFCFRHPEQSDPLLAGLRKHDGGSRLNVVMSKSGKGRARREAALHAADVIINASGLGSTGPAPEGDAGDNVSGAPATLVDRPEWLHPGQCCCDLVLEPRETAFLKVAREQGATCLDGLSLLVARALESFKAWTGQSLDLKDMVQALDDRTGFEGPPGSRPARR